MKTIKAFVDSWIADEDGVTSIEYAILGMLIAVVIALAVGSVGTAVKALFGRVAAGF